MTKRIKVYRVEDRDQNGPYREADLKYMVDVRAYNRLQFRRPVPHHPLEPWSKGHRRGHKSHDHHVCGFTSMKQLRRWFTKRDLAMLEQHGFKVNTYLVHPRYVKTGERQCTFYPGAAKRL